MFNEYFTIRNNMFITIHLYRVSEENKTVSIFCRILVVKVKDFPLPQTYLIQNDVNMIMLCSLYEQIGNIFCCRPWWRQYKMYQWCQWCLSAKMISKIHNVYKNYNKTTSKRMTTQTKAKIVYTFYTEILWFLVS